MGNYLIKTHRIVTEEFRQWQGLHSLLTLQASSALNTMNILSPRKFMSKVFQPDFVSHRKGNLSVQFQVIYMTFTTLHSKPFRRKERFNRLF